MHLDIVAQLAGQVGLRVLVANQYDDGLVGLQLVTQVDEEAFRAPDIQITNDLCNDHCEPRRTRSTRLRRLLRSQRQRLPILRLVLAVLFVGNPQAHTEE